MDSAAFFIVGPTAVGKSEIAAEVAARCGGEIIGMDAFQVYEGMPILTAKPSANVLARVPHHLLGTVPLACNFDVAQYLEAATACAREVTARGALPIFVGGNGLYLRALTRGISDLPPADPELRATLDSLSLDELKARYEAADPAGAAVIDSKNKRRLIRALEVCTLTGRPFSTFRSEWKNPPASSFSGVLLTRDRDDLHRRIDRRVEEMFRAGLLAEVRELPDLGPTASQVLGLRDARACVAGEISGAECKERIARATRQYAKRQLTWFRRETMFALLNLTTLPHSESLIRLILEKARTALHP